MYVIGPEATIPFFTRQKIMLLWLHSRKIHKQLPRLDKIHLARLEEKHIQRKTMLFAATAYLSLQFFSGTIGRIRGKPKRPLMADAIYLYLACQTLVMNFTFPMTVLDEKFDDMANKVMQSKILDQMKPE